MSFDTYLGGLYHPRRMGQRFRPSLIRTLLAICPLLVVVGCERGPAATTAPAKARPTIASLSPAATDLLVGMGAADHLVAVSHFDYPRPETQGLPKIGDYQTTDWERLRQVRPDVMVIQVRPDRLPEGLAKRAEELDVRLVNIRIDRLEDILRTLGELGEAVEEPARAATARERLQGQFDAVRQRVAGRAPVRTLIVTDAEGRYIVGTDNFLEELLHIAGGENAAAGMGRDYPSIDREKLRALAPDAVIQLLPGASEQTLVRARSFWQTLPDLPAVKDGRVYVFTEPYVLMPGYQVGHLAERFADALHPQPATAPAAQDGP